MSIKSISNKKLLFVTILILILSSQIVFSLPIGMGQRDISQSSSTYWLTVDLASAGDWDNPVVIMGPPTYNGSEPTTVRVKNLSSSSFQVQIDEWNYLDGSHNTERADLVVLDWGYQDVDGMAVVAGNNTVDHNWATFGFGNYASPPVIIAQCASYNGSDAVTVRIRNVTTSTFEMKLQEEEANGAHVMESVTWAAFEVGKYNYFEVKRISNVTDSWQFVSNDADLTDCYILANMQTYNGSDPATLRLTRYSGNGNFSIKVEEEQSYDSETTHAGETVGLVLCNYGFKASSATSRILLPSLNSEQVNRQPLIVIED